MPLSSEKYPGLNSIQWHSTATITITITITITRVQTNDNNCLDVKSCLAQDKDANVILSIMYLRLSKNNINYSNASFL